MFIFLDDYRKPSDVTWTRLPYGPWTIVRDYEGFVSLVESLEEAPTFVAWDHDLADAHYDGDFSNPDEKTGYDAAKWFVDHCVAKGWKLPEYQVHSLNPDGKKNIEGYLENAKKHLEI